MDKRIIASVFVLFALWARDAAAFAVLTSEAPVDARWQLPAVPVFLDVNVAPGLSVEQVEAAIAASLETWQKVECSTLAFTYAGVVDSPPKAGIYIRWAELGEVVADAAAITETYLTNGEIHRADMHMNPQFGWTTSEIPESAQLTDVEGVVTHELGHAIGLAHTRERHATMFYAGGDSSLRSIEDDDRRALCFLYPAASFTDGRSCDSCLTDADCGKGACLRFPAGGDFCAGPCTADSDCKGGFTCTLVPAAGRALCLPNNLYCHEGGSNIAVGDYCYGSATCASGQCLPTHASAQCTQPCLPSVGIDCPGDTQCLPQPGACEGGDCGMCVRAGEGGIGAACYDATECESSICVGGEGVVGSCSAFCDDGAPCPDDATCAGGYCVVPGPRPVGAPCQSPFECEGMVCVSLGDVPRCSAACDGAPCPSGSTCERLEVSNLCTKDADCGAGRSCENVGKSSLGLCGCSRDTDCGQGETCGKVNGSGPRVCQVLLCELPAGKSGSGGLCDLVRGCDDGLACDMGSATWGICRPPCTPGEGGCGDSEACAWAPGEGPTGTCAQVTGTVGAACSSELPCGPGLACTASGGEVVCRADCRVGEQGCGDEPCVDLGADAYPGRGVCMPGPGTVELVLPLEPTAPEPPPPADEPPGGGQIDGSGYVPNDQVPAPDEGCRASGGPLSWGAAALLLLLLAGRRDRSARG